jgi:hypothetical protein
MGRKNITSNTIEQRVKKHNLNRYIWNDLGGVIVSGVYYLKDTLVGTKVAFLDLPIFHINIHGSVHRWANLRHYWTGGVNTDELAVAETEFSGSNSLIVEGKCYSVNIKELKSLIAKHRDHLDWEGIRNGHICDLGHELSDVPPCLAIGYASWVIKRGSSYIVGLKSGCSHMDFITCTATYYDREFGAELVELK